MSGEVLENLQLIYKEESEYAYIRLYETEDKKILFTLNTYAQILEGQDEQTYHNNFVCPYKCNKNKIKNILIGGGGDGCLARELFKLNPLLNITIVDIDEKVIELFKSNDRLVKLNERSLFKCNVIIKDIKKFISNISDKFDAIFLDLPDPNNKELKTLYRQSFISKIPLILKSNGLFVMQSPLRYNKRILGLSKKYIGDSKSLFYKMPFLGCGSFVYSFNNRNYCIGCGKLLPIRNKSGKCNLCNLKQGRTNITEESRRKISESVKKLWENEDYRRKQVIAHKGNSFYNSGQFKKGQHASLETEFKKGQHVSSETEFKSGKEHLGYIDGRSFEEYPKEFNDKLRDLIRKRDKYQCQNEDCGMTEREHIIVYGRNLEIHHIDYNKKNCKENNLLTLYKKCNLRANYNRNYWQEYYKRRVLL